MEKKETDVLVLGGGAAGCAAAWQAAVLGVRVLVVEPSPWLGGMITAAGVSAFDGNKAAMASGFYRRLRTTLEDYYGGKKKVFTGWISETCFEPKVGARFIHQFLDETSAEILHGAELKDMIVEGKRVLGALITHQGKTFEVRARITIDATEYGDGLHLAGIPFSIGREAKSETGEADAPEQADMEVQDMTVCAILQKHKGNAPGLPKPPNYDPAEFDCSTAILCTTPDPKIVNHALHDWESFIGYATLPNNKYLLNWPFHSNDSPDTNGVFGTPGERATALKVARERTLRYVYYIQNDLGHPEWGLATDEFDTADNLAYIPYVREGRRMYGVVKMMEADVLPVGNGERARFNPDSIAVGDYYLDHHHSKMHLPPGKRLEENYPDNAPFQVPYWSLVPREHDGFLAAEKNISVSHIVNGCTRLQPCVMLTGQAVGAAAAFCVGQGIEPRDLNVRQLQDFLIRAGVALWPTIDVDNTHEAFGAIQRLAMKGIFLGAPGPDGQAPSTDEMTDGFAFKPDAVIDADEARRRCEVWARVTGRGVDEVSGIYHEGMTRGQFHIALDQA